MISCCNGLKDFITLQNLVLDRNILSNAEGRDQAGAAVAELLSILPALHMLSFQGASADIAQQSYSMGAAIRPVLEVFRVECFLRSFVRRIDLCTDHTTTPVFVLCTTSQSLPVSKIIQSRRVARISSTSQLIL